MNFKKTWLPAGWNRPFQEEVKMKGPLHEVNMDACSGDGLCADVCPQNVLEIADGKAVTVENRASECILCGQCVAVCPNDALRMPALPEKNFGELAGPPLAYDDFLAFLQKRRSVRVFKDRPVEQDMIDKILSAAATAPMGFPPHSTEVLVIQNREEFDFLLKTIVKEYDFLVKGVSNPLGRAFIRLAAGGDSYSTMKNYIVDLARHANEAYHRNGTDRYMYHAPVLMLFHANRNALSFEENAHLVCHHAMLAAVTLGLGTTIIGMVPPIVDRSKVLRQRYSIPEDNRVITSLIIGHPKYKYRKSIRRDLAGIRTI
jgi:NAD-dependent dihydropyrimidine dehydrogenase PreA subunit/nitroreductase